MPTLTELIDHQRNYNLALIEQQRQEALKEPDKLSLTLVKKQLYVTNHDSPSLGVWEDVLVREDIVGVYLSTAMKSTEIQDRKDELRRELRQRDQLDQMRDQWIKGVQRNARLEYNTERIDVPVAQMVDQPDGAYWLKPTSKDECRLFKIENL
ncbi:hypothetical protein J4210_03660 [Candidatus Woesearchaeota archaeon]|nr:hypothetical protein [Candidatus Woesearchaeota archaeon]